MKVPFLDLRAQYESIRDEVEAKIADIVSSQRFVLGPEVEGLEDEIARYQGVRCAVGVSSGTDALVASLMALGVNRGDRVVTTPFTFFATAGAVERLGADTVFCDIDPRTFNLDPEELERVLETTSRNTREARVRVVVPVHLFGQCADMQPILDAAEKHGIPVLEDAAQAIGAEYPAASGVKRAGGMGEAATLSFYPAKNLGAFGDGGMVLTDNTELAERLRILRVHGEKNRYIHEFVGGNFRLDELQAGVLRVKLRHLDVWLEARKERAALYDGLFRESGLTEEGLVRLPTAVFKASGVRNFHTYHQYVIRARNRDRLRDHLRDQGVASGIYYPLPLHLQACFSRLGYKRGDFPQAEKASEEVLALPIYPELSASQQEYVVFSIKEFYAQTLP